MYKKCQDPMKAREIVHSQMTRNDESEIHCLQLFLGFFFSKLPHLSIKYKYTCTVIQIMGSTLPPQSSSYLRQQNHLVQAANYNALFKGNSLKITIHLLRNLEHPTNMGPYFHDVKIPFASCFLSPKSARNSAKTSKCKVRTRRMSRAKRAT